MVNKSKITVLALCFSIVFSAVSSAETAIPIGINKASTTTPGVGYIYACEMPRGGGGAQKTGDWIQNDYWTPSKKPTVDGNVSWPSAQFILKALTNKRQLVGNGLPINHTTGVYPVAIADDAYKFDRNPNTIRAQNISLQLPINPSIAAKPNCLPMGMIGIMTNGVALFNALDGEGRDAAAYEIQDTCGGHPERSGQYHYHNMSNCLTKKSVANKQQLVGYALDGFPIYNSYNAQGKKLSNKDLDICHGVKSSISWNGKKKNMYHYVMTDEFPYSLGCFRGTPISTRTSTGGTSGQQGGNTGGGSSGGGGSAPTTRTPSIEQQPPEDEAVMACRDKAEGSPCNLGPNPIGNCVNMGSRLECVGKAQRY